jgi:hypothetical protein
MDAEQETAEIPKAPGRVFGERTRIRNWKQQKSRKHPEGFSENELGSENRFPGERVLKGWMRNWNRNKYENRTL